MACASILIIDDENSFREFMAECLSQEGYKVTQFDPAESKDTLLKGHFDIAIVDLIMPGRDGFAMRQEVLKHNPDAQFIFVTGYPDQQKVDKAMELGVHNFLVKPFRSDHIRYAVLGALRIRDLFQRNLKYDVLHSSKNLGLVGDSAQMMKVRKKIMELAPTELPVLVTGESGTGKELVAQAIFKNSLRSAYTFITINCAALSPNLIEAELFGHTKGAFTGADMGKRGFFEAADKGAIFLDEIGELPLDLQSKLLRVLDKGEFNAVGDVKARITNIRIISATNRDLKQMVAKGTFRKDLYYRLRGCTIHIPPLRERPDDIAPLAKFFLGDDIAISLHALGYLKSNEWQGNCRELSMIMKGLKNLAVNKLITPEAVTRILGREDGGTANTGTGLVPYKEAKAKVLEAFERDYFNGLLKEAEGNLSKAAALAGMDRKNFRDKIKTLKLNF